MVDAVLETSRVGLAVIMSSVTSDTVLLSVSSPSSLVSVTTATVELPVAITKFITLPESTADCSNV